MLQDIEQGRETEIEAITGQVIRRAELLNLPVPVNRVVYDLVKAKVATAKRSQPVKREQCPEWSFEVQEVVVIARSTD